MPLTEIHFQYTYTFRKIYVILLHRKLGFLVDLERWILGPAMLTKCLIIFDKDGTLFDFNATWSHWIVGYVSYLSEKYKSDQETLYEILGYNQASGVFLSSSIFAHSTAEEIAKNLANALKVTDYTHLLHEMNERVGSASQVVVKGLVRAITRLSNHHAILAIVTNDAFQPTIAHLNKIGLRERFSEIIASDSTFLPKPNPESIDYLVSIFSTHRSHTFFIGDSVSDMMAAKAAGVNAIGVLTGATDRATLLDCADHVFPTATHAIEHIERISFEEN